MESALWFLADFGATEARFSRGLRRLWAKTRAPGPHRGCKRLLGGRSGPENGGSARGCAIDRGGCAIDRFWGESENRLAVALRKGAKQPPVSRVSVVMPTARLRLLHAHLAPATATASATAEAAAAAAADTTIDQSESDRIAAEFQRTGVVVLPGFFAPPALAPLNDAIAQLVATTQPWSTDVASRRGPYKDKYKALFDTELVSLPFTANHPDAVAALLADRKLAAVTAAVLGADYTELGPMCFGCVAISVSRCLVRVLSVLSSTRWKESHRLTAWLSFHRRPLLLHV